MKNCGKSIDSSYIEYLDANNLYGWAKSQKIPINGFKWVENLSQFNESFIKHYDENSNTGYFLDVDIGYPTRLLNVHKYLPFLPERKKGWKSWKTNLQHRRQEKICYSHTSFKTSIKSWIKT